MTAAYTANSTEGRILLALRAGEMESEACYERFTGFPQWARGLLASGLIERSEANHGVTYRITAAGRAACPFRNPLLAAPGSAPAQPKETVMTKKITAEQLLEHIVAAGPRGTTVKGLAIDLGVSDQCIFNQRKKIEDKFFIRRRSVMVANQFMETAAAPAAVAAEAALAAEVKELERQYDEMIDFEIEPAAGEPSTGAMANHAETSVSPVATAGSPPAHGPDTFIADLRESAARAGIRTASGPRMPPVIEDVSLIDPDTVEFAIFSSGGLDIYSDDGTVTMTAPVLRKLRDFLDLFLGPA